MAKDLREYREKRDFHVSSEPHPQQDRREGGEGPLSFVVQKHRARQLHYDLRLELDGVLKSWSVPKGPSLDPEDKRLAVMVEDHPIEYAGFEGTIPRGGYGAGEVVIWDNGTYSPYESGQFLFGDRAEAESQVRQGLERGKLSFFLRGHKLRGSWALVKMQRQEKEWLLIKQRDQYAGSGYDVLTEERSVLSGLSVEDIRAGRSRGPATSSLKPQEIPGARAATLAPVSPMLAESAEKPFSHPNWIFEPKLDGYRTIACVRSGDVTLYSRRGSNVTAQYPPLVRDLSLQPASELIIDGEIIALDEKGRQCFQCLQQYARARGRTDSGRPGAPLVYYVFDVLYLDGYDLRNVPLLARKNLLHAILQPTAQVRLVAYFPGDGETTYEAAVNAGLEGVIAKEDNSLYESGSRSRRWLKIKAMQSDDFVIGGFSEREMGRADTFSSLLLGNHDAAGRLVFAGHVGSGFDDQTLSNLRSRLEALSTDVCPFGESPPLNAPTTWVRPELVAEIKFSGWTAGRQLRDPVFVRLREDKPAAEVRPSEPVPVGPSSTGSAGDALGRILDQLQNPKNAFNIEVEGNRVSLSNMEKPLWPETDSHPLLTKRDLLMYLTRVSPHLLPHLKDRPLTLTRYPNGVSGEHFYQKHWNGRVPEFVRRVDVGEKKSSREYLVCDNLSTLLWLGQIANIELHTWLASMSVSDHVKGTEEAADPLDYPDFIVFDLDPFIYSGREPAGAEPELNRDGFARVCEAALRLKAVLEELSLNAFVKTSGKTGLHIYVPIARNLDFRAARHAAETIGKFLVQEHPGDITTEWAQERRTGKVFVDYAQNTRGKTLASAYSPRPTTHAAVSMPLEWDRLGGVYPTDFTLLTVPDRLASSGDLWADILSARQDLTRLIRTVW